MVSFVRDFVELRIDYSIVRAPDRAERLDRQCRWREHAAAVLRLLPSCQPRGS